MCCVFFLIFFFKQKTAYEMRISDWSSDVCSSDLHLAARTSYGVEMHRRQPLPVQKRRRDRINVRITDDEGVSGISGVSHGLAIDFRGAYHLAGRGVVVVRQHRRRMRGQLSRGSSSIDGDEPLRLAHFLHGEMGQGGAPLP